jgi:hypothetical protein
MQLEFDWDPIKAESNRRKHGVAFEAAMGVFSDPLALSLLDNESGEAEERWVTERSWYVASGRSYLCRTGSRSGGDPHHLGALPEPSRDQVL